MALAKEDDSFAIETMLEVTLVLIPAVCWNAVGIEFILAAKLVRTVDRARGEEEDNLETELLFATNSLARKEVLLNILF